MTSLLRFEDVRCVRGGRLLFEGLSFAVGPGEALHVLGPNGSGKSSLIRIAAGLLRAEGGRIERSSVALADAATGLDPELGLKRALRFWIGAEAGEAMRSLGLGGLGDVPVRHLSTGQAKRASLARVAGSGAPLWLLDEPLNGVDRVSGTQIEALIADHRARGGAVLAASHTPIAGEWTRLELAA